MEKSTSKDFLILSAPFLVCGIVAGSVAWPLMNATDYDGLRRWETFIACGDDARRCNDAQLAQQFYRSALDESRDFRENKDKQLIALVRLLETESDCEYASQQIQTAIDEAERCLNDEKSDEKRVEILSNLLGLWELELDSAVRRKRCDQANRILEHAGKVIASANLKLDYLAQNQILSLVNRGFEQKDSRCDSGIRGAALRVSALLSEAIRAQCSTRLWQRGTEYDTEIKIGLDLVKRGDSVGGAKRFHQAQRCIEPGEPRSLKAKALFWAALAEFKAGLPDSMRASFDSALNLASAAEDYPLEETITLARTSLRQGDVEHVRAQAALTASRLKIYGADSPGLKEELFGTIGALRTVRDLPAALRQAEKARTVAQQRGNRDDEAEALFQMANIYEDMHDVPSSVEVYEQVVALMGRELREPNLSSTFKICSLSEEPPKLLFVFPVAESWLATRGTAPFRREDVERCLHLVRAYNYCKMFGKARDLSSRLLDLQLDAEKTNQVKTSLARAYMGLEELNKAEAVLKETLSFYKSKDMPNEVFFGLVRLSQVYVEKTSVDQARACLNEAFTIAKRCSNPSKKEAAIRSRLAELR